MSDPSQPITIKVTDNEHRCYYVRFTRDTHELIEISKYETTYTPRMGVPSGRHKHIIDAARTKLGQPVGEKQ